MSLEDEIKDAMERSKDEVYHGIQRQPVPSAKPVSEIERLRNALTTEYERLDHLMSSLRVKQEEVNTALYEASTSIEAVTQALKRLSADQQPQSTARYAS